MSSFNLKEDEKFAIEQFSWRRKSNHVDYVAIFCTASVFSPFVRQAEKNVIYTQMWILGWRVVQVWIVETWLVQHFFGANIGCAVDCTKHVLLRIQHCLHHFSMSKLQRWKRNSWQALFLVENFIFFHYRKFLAAFYYIIHNNKQLRRTEENTFLFKLKSKSMFEL